MSFRLRATWAVFHTAFRNPELRRAIALLADVPRTASVVAATSVRLYGLAKEPFLTAVIGHPASSRAAESVAACRGAELAVVDERVR